MRWSAVRISVLTSSLLCAFASLRAISFPRPSRIHGSRTRPHIERRIPPGVDGCHENSLRPDDVSGLPGWYDGAGLDYDYEHEHRFAEHE